MSTFHFFLQGKGGVGKSLASSLMAQYVKDKDPSVICIDTDPVNHTFEQYKEFDVTSFNIIDDNGFNTGEFDTMVEFLVENNKDAIIDNGATTFVPLSQYIVENQLFEALNEMNIDVVIHSVVVGGSGLDDTTNGLLSLLSSTNENTKFVIWLNNYFGEINNDNFNFTKTALFKRYENRIIGIVNLDKKSQLFENDFREMTSKKITFDKAIESAKLMSKNRFKIMKNDIYSQLNNIFPIEQLKD